MLEKSIETKLRQEVEKLGGKAYKIESVGNLGMPDRLICLPDGKIIFVETKRPKGGCLSKIQKYRIQELKNLGADVRVISTLSQVDEFIKGVMQNEVYTT